MFVLLCQGESVGSRCATQEATIAATQQNSRPSASNDYRFVDSWRVQSTLDEVYAVMTRGDEFARWWPGIYLDSRVIERGDANGLGGTVEFLSQGGRLLYTLRWTAHTFAINRPYGFTLSAGGDFVGTGRWTFAQDGDWVDMTFEWNIRAENALLRYGSFFMKPILAANHRFAMRVGERSLRLELARRHARTDEERAAIPPPPAPITAATVVPRIGAGLAAAAAVACGFILVRRRR